MAKVAFIGLGVMGFPMAGHLRTRGKHHVTVYNRTREKADKWVATHGGTVAPTPRAAAEPADFLLSSVGTDDHLRSMPFGVAGTRPGLRPRAIFIDTTTASATR